ncbi:ring finger protein goliath isoform X3 [Haemaphysalis longicornis]
MGGAGLAAALWLLLLPPWVVAAGGAEYSALVNLTFVHPSTGQLVCEQVAAGGSAAGLGSRPGSASGQLVHVSGDACSALDTAAVPPREPWIALIQLGNCAEALKLRHAAAANASGAVLYYGAATAGHALFGTRRHKVSSLPPAALVWVLVGQEQGRWLAGLVDNGTRVVVQVWVGGARPFLYPSINRTSVLFVSVSFILLMLISLAWLVFYYVQRFRYVHAKDLLARRLCSAAQRALERMPVQRWAGGGGEGCAVCLEPLQPGELVRRLPCGHCFHQPCVDPWLLEQRSCPMCKMDILRHCAGAFRNPLTSKNFEICASTLRLFRRAFQAMPSNNGVLLLTP